ncbi:MAG: DNA methylase [Erysipelotrichaceae bacterium]
MEEKTYIAIDLKSFYASVECRERGLNPLVTNLVVADASRTDKTICLAVTPSLKAYGISGRARLFEVKSKVKQINNQRRKQAYKYTFTAKSYNDTELKNNKNLELDFIIAPPRMAYYMEYSAKIFDIYRKYISSQDIHVYSIDEVFIDATSYLKIYNKTAAQLAQTIIKDVLFQTGITATAGIGTNLYLCKVAMDIVAKHMDPDENGVRIASLDEMSYRKLLWQHTPLTDFWRIGKGISRKLQENGMYNMGDIALCSIENEDKLYKLFGVNAELLIDHAWGYEPTEIKHIKQYHARNNSLSTSQVLSRPYTFSQAKIVLKEMAEMMALDLVEKNLVSNQVVVSIMYDKDNLEDEALSRYVNETVLDGYGRVVPKPSTGRYTFAYSTSSTVQIRDGACQVYDKIAHKQLLIRKLSISCAVVKKEMAKKKEYQQFSLFDTNEEQPIQQPNQQNEEKEAKVQKTIIEIKKRFGKNAIMNVSDLQSDATLIKRNSEIGGHKA